MKKLNKRSIIKYLTKQNDNFQKLSEKTHQNPNNKNIHDLRVTIRRMRVAFWLLSHGSPQLTFDKLHKSLQKLGSVLGECRELDVAIQDASYYHLKNQKLKSFRSQKRGEVKKIINSKRRNKILSLMSVAIKKVEKKSKIEFAPGVNKIRSELKPWINKKPVLEKDFHILRIEIKKVRYSLETMGLSTPPLQKLQFHLGRAHDLEVLQDYLHKNNKVQHSIKSHYQSVKQVIEPALHFAFEQLK